MGPPASELLQRVTERVRRGEVEAVVIVTQTRDERLSLYSAGCTVLETVGMLAWAGHLAQDGLAVEEGPEGEGEEEGETLTP